MTTQTLQKLLELQTSIEQEIIKYEGELTPDTELLLTNLQRDVDIKLDAYAFVTQNIEAKVGQLKELAKQYNQLAQRLEHKKEWLESQIKNYLLASDLKEVEGNNFIWSLRKNPPKVVIENSEVLPHDYQRTTMIVEPDKTKIKEALKDGINVPGCSLTQDERIVWKPKI